MRRRMRGGNQLMHLQDEMNRIFQDFWGGSFPEGWSIPARMAQMAASEQSSQFMPRVDVHETDSAVQISAELPGMDVDDIEINCERDRLRIRGEKTSQKTSDDEGVYHAERVFGAFERTIMLPHEVDVDKAEAHFNNGVLTVEIPRVEPGSKSKKISIKRQED